MDSQKIRILAHSPSAIERLSRHRWAALGVGGFALVGMVAAFALAPSGDEGRAPLQTVLEQLSTPTAILAQEGGSEGNSFLREERILRSDTLASLTTRLGISDPQALAFIQQNAQSAAIARQLRPGKLVT